MPISKKDIIFVSKDIYGRKGNRYKAEIIEGELRSIDSDFVADTLIPLYSFSKESLESLRDFLSEIIENLK